MKHTIIACVNKSGALGVKGDLLYHIKEDLKRFKELTQDQVVIMGRKTFESLPNQATLKNRVNIILTNNLDFNVDVSKISEGSELFIVHTIQELTDLEEAMFSDKELFVIGGASIYNQMLLEEDLVNRLEMTVVDEYKDGDVYFPIINMDKWQEVSKEERFDEKNNLKFSFNSFIKVN